MDFDDLESGRDFGRYLDVDNDGITYRTYPGTHPKRGAYFTRGTTKDSYARYSEEGAVYVANMERLRKKFETAKALVPGPVLREAAKPTRAGVLYFGSTSPAMSEALDLLEDDNIYVDALRVRAYPFCDDIMAFIAARETIFVVEQNCDAQLRGMLILEGNLNAAKLIPVLHYDGTPITARFIAGAIAGTLGSLKVTPIKKVAQ
jgi:2-oxoglutarate/2-oxoacid ferredoxin oxidoreductase subunit alpha